MRHVRSPFEIAIISLLMAIGIPSVIFMFGAVRSRQLQSKANPRWAQFAKATGPTSAETAAANELPRASIRTASIRSESASDVEPPHPPTLESSLTGSATGHSSIEYPVHSGPLSPSSMRRDEPHNAQEPVASQPIIFRPVDDPQEPADQTEVRLLQSTKQLESRLVEVRQRIDLLAHQQQQIQTDDIQRDAQLFESMKKLHETLESKQSPADGHCSIVRTDRRSSRERSRETASLESSRMLPSAPGSSEADEIRFPQQKANEQLFTMEARNADIRQFLVQLSEVTGVSILASADVCGEISLKLYAVPFETALNAIVKSRNCVLERDGDIVIISTAAEVARLKHQNRKLSVRAYQPSYLSAAQFRHLVEPLLSSDGRQSVSRSTARESMQAPFHNVSDESNARESVVVQDVAEVLDRIDQLLIETDTPPRHLEIEAKIISVRLSSRHQQGIDMRQLPCECDMATSHEGGLKQSSLLCSVPAFIQSIKRLGETRIVGSQRIQILDKHRAELLIGDRLGLQSNPGDRIHGTDSETRLVLRPTIAADGSVRVEIHPERTRGILQKHPELAKQNNVETVTPILVKDGATIAIGGLISEEITDLSGRGSLKGSNSDEKSSPHHQNERLQRTEFIILLTPHILSDGATTTTAHRISTAKGQSARLREYEAAKARQRLARSPSGPISR